jgi:hypothetical protein
MIREAEEHTVGRRPALGSARPGHQDGARRPASIGLPADSFDLVHERTLLPSVYHSEELVAETTRLARPGGVVALQTPTSQPGPSALRTPGRSCCAPSYSMSTREAVETSIPSAARRACCAVGRPRSVSSPGSPRPASTSRHSCQRCHLHAAGDLAPGRLTPSKLDSTITELGEHLGKTRHAGLACRPSGRPGEESHEARSGASPGTQAATE